MIIRVVEPRRVLLTDGRTAWLEPGTGECADDVAGWLIAEGFAEAAPPETEIDTTGMEE